MNIRLKDNVDIYPDYVIVFGQRVDRPSDIARSTWMKLWEMAGA